MTYLELKYKVTRWAGRAGKVGSDVLNKEREAAKVLFKGISPI